MRITSECVSNFENYNSGWFSFVPAKCDGGFTVEALQGEKCPDLLLSGGGRSVRAKISGGRGRPWGIFFSFYKTRDILLSDSANCTVLRAIVLTQYRRVTERRTDRRTDGETDRQTDGIAVASTALAMRVLRRAVKTHRLTAPKTEPSAVHCVR